jgi:hypothetical protein
MWAICDAGNMSCDCARAYGTLVQRPPGTFVATLAHDSMGALWDRDLRLTPSCFLLGALMTCRAMYLTAAITASALCSFSIGHAQTMEPLSYTNSPIGLNFLIAGYTHQSGSVLVDPSLPIKNVRATVESAFLTYSHVVDCWGQSGSLALVVPYAWLSASGDVLEQNRSVDRTGLSDLSLRLSVNLYGAPALSLSEFPTYHQDTIIGVSLRVSAPSGQYFPSKLVNIGTNRWSFAPEVGLSKGLGRWTFEAAPSVIFFTDNDKFLGNNVRREGTLFSAQGHVIYNFNRRLWVALDADYYTGGRTALNGSLDDDLQRNSRWGGTFAYSLAKHNSIKLYFSSGLAAREGTDFRIVGIAWQYRWGAGL